MRRGWLKAQNFPHYPCFMGNEFELSNRTPYPKTGTQPCRLLGIFSHITPRNVWRKRKKNCSNCGKLGHWSSVRTSWWCFRRLEPIACHSRLLPWQLQGHPTTKGIRPHGAVCHEQNGVTSDPFRPIHSHTPTIHPSTLRLPQHIPRLFLWDLEDILPELGKIQFTFYL